MVKKIISGGQTGADQAALDVALKLGIPHGGWIPKGRITEGGMLDDRYQLQEMETTNYNKRTEKNVIDSDGTLILSHGPLTGGSEYTREMAIQHKRSWLHIDLYTTIAFQAAQKIRAWIAENNIEVLNVAGSRASK
ncbi:MAG: putative molybdenum carrier protein, partial [Proteobacteria bacterium]|nr:putative molybdenum carrier protein [Pseudomonadota bacterium]